MNAEDPLNAEVPDDEPADGDAQSPSDKTDPRIDELAEGFLNRLRAGETVSLEELVSQHPELAPHLETRLKLYKVIYRATRRPSGAAHTANTDATIELLTDSATTSSHRDAALRLACPHCGNRIQLIGHNIVEVTCGSCGSAVRVDTSQIGDEKRREQADMPKRLGHFRPLRILGEGGFGVVFLAEDLNLDNRRVALKIPRHGFFATQEEERRFMREARNTARLRHPNIAQIYEISEDRNTPFIVSELIEGMTLRDLANSKTLSQREIAELMIQVTEAVEYAHRNKIIHRDLKSSNVLVDHQQHAYVVDFGLSRRDDAELTLTIEGAVLGTVQYMSPEQAAGKQSAVGPWSDIYSMGVILYELLCHQLPFHGTKQMMVNQVILDEPRNPRSLNESVPRDLETITLKAMAKLPKQRYASSQALGDDLRRWLLGEPISARPISRLGRGWSWCRRHPTTAALSATIAGLLLVGTTISVLWALDQARLKQVAVAAHRDSDQRQYELLMQNGSRALDNHELARASLWFSEALDISDNPVNRTRIGMIQDQLPKLTQLWSTNKAVDKLVFVGDQLAALSWEGQVQLFDLRSQTALFTQQLDPFSQCDFSSSGASFVLCGNEKFARLWDVPRGRLIRHLDHQDLVVSAEFHSSDQLVVTGSFDSFARVWNGTDGTLKTEHQFEGMRVNRVAFVPNSDLIVVVTQSIGQLSNTLHLWNYVEDRIVATGMEHADHIMNLAFAEQAEQICSVSRGGDVRIWDWDSGAPVGAGFKLPFAPKQVLFGGSAKQLVAIDYKYDVELWDISSGQRVGPQIRSPNGFSAAAQDQLNRLIALAGTDGTVRVYWQQNGALACSVLHNSESASSVTFHPDGRRLAVGGRNGMLQLWDLAGAAAESYVFEHEGAVRNALFSPDAERCLTIGLEGKAFLWNADSGQQIGAALAHSGGIAECALSHDGKVFATASNDQSVKLWDGFNGAQIGNSLDHSAPVTTLVFSPNDELLLTGCLDGTVSCWESQQIRNTSLDPAVVQPRFLGKHNTRIVSLAFSPQHDLAASASLDGLIRCWNVNTGNQQYGPFRHPDAACCLFLPDGQQLLSCGANGWVYIWNIASGEILHRLQCGGAVSSARLFAGGDGILTNEEGGRTRVWRRSGKHIELAYTVQHASTESIYFSDMNPDASILAFAGGSLALGRGRPQAGEAVLWDTQGQRLLGPPLKHLGPVRRVYFDATGERLLTASEDHTARLWNLVSNPLPRQDAIRIARLYAQQRRDADGRLIIIPPAEQVAEYIDLSTQYPALFRSSAAEIKLWNDDARRLLAKGSDLQASSDSSGN